MKRHRSGESGFTVVELLAVVVIIGIIAVIGLPSFLAQKQVMRKTINSTTTLLKIVNLSARANSGNPYRITLGSAGGEQYFEVETELSGTCDATRETTDPPEWRQDPSKRLFLPSTIRLSGLPQGSAVVSGGQITTINGICFNGRGELVGETNTFQLTDEEYGLDGGSKARTAIFTVSAVGDVTVAIKDASGNPVDQY